MKQQDRKWFDFVYKTIRQAVTTEGDFTPMVYYTSNNPFIEHNRKKYFFHNEDLIKKMRRAAEDIPNPDAFLEEKARVMDESREMIKQSLPNARSIFYFGRALGDIDLAGIIENGSRSPPLQLILDYPLYDWISFHRLSGKDPKEIMERMIYSNSIARNKSITPSTIRKSGNTLKRARLLGGKQGDLIDMRKLARTYQYNLDEYTIPNNMD